MIFATLLVVVDCYKNQTCIGSWSFFVVIDFKVAHPILVFLWRSFIHYSNPATGWFDQSTVLESCKFLSNLKIHLLAHFPGRLASMFYIIRCLFCFIRYQVMVNCWNELAENRPTFPDLVREFDSMISMLSEKVKIMVTAPFKVFSLRFKASLREIGTNYHNKNFTLRLSLWKRGWGERGNGLFGF